MLYKQESKNFLEFLPIVSSPQQRNKRVPKLLGKICPDCWGDVRDGLTLHGHLKNLKTSICEIFVVIWLQITSASLCWFVSRYRSVSQSVSPSVRRNLCEFSTTLKICLYMAKSQFCSTNICSTQTNIKCTDCISLKTVSITLYIRKVFFKMTICKVLKSGAKYFGI